MVAQTAEYQYGGMAGVCLYNLRKTFRHGGRRLLPGTVEVQQLMVSSKFHFLSYIYFLVFITKLLSVAFTFLMFLLNTCGYFAVRLYCYC